MDRYETFATWIFIVFGALIIAGLMAFAITSGDKPAFPFRSGFGMRCIFSWLRGDFRSAPPPAIRTYFVCVGSADRGPYHHCDRDLIRGGSYYFYPSALI